MTPEGERIKVQTPCAHRREGGHQGGHGAREARRARGSASRPTAPLKANTRIPTVAVTPVRGTVRAPWYPYELCPSSTPTPARAPAPSCSPRMRPAAPPPLPGCPAVGPARGVSQRHVSTARVNGTCQRHVSTAGCPAAGPARIVRQHVVCGMWVDCGSQRRYKARGTRYKVQPPALHKCQRHGRG